MSDWYNPTNGDIREIYVRDQIRISGYDVLTNSVFFGKDFDLGTIDIAYSKDQVPKISNTKYGVFGGQINIYFS